MTGGGDSTRRDGSLSLSARGIAVRTALVAIGIFALAAILGDGSFLWMAGGAVLTLLAAIVLFRNTTPLQQRLKAPARRGDKGIPPAAVLAALPEPVVVVDRRSLVTGMNAAAKTMLPALREATPLSFALRSPDVLGGIEAVLRNGETRSVELIERVPIERSYEVHIAPLEALDGASQERRGAVLMFRDLTAARRLEHMRVDFVANASHELRTPLASVLGFIETLQGPARDDAKARERFLAIMREQARRMSRLIDDLLSLSRIEMHAHVQPATTVDLLAIVRHMIDTLSPLAAESGVTIALDAPEGPIEVKGDRDELLRVFENLIENAVKYGQSGQRVEVTVTTSHDRPGGRDEVEVAVRDFGPGIPPEHLPRLTERFYRVSATDSRQKGGTGLGLAIVKHIVNRHRGHLLIDSTFNEGATFRVQLPLAASTMRELPVVAPPPAGDPQPDRSRVA
ncbi:ATP-binding protein [Chelatococcus asaccharovorans]|uniref:histidine kinase n=1 Tax=Chelatococcus asaccharovorans TaxID=28210 RepID=A0A2V3UI21_9HYPH|nr:ATP-binding protein [Chelatococcus asaccharovorans]MBS7706537.1 two-component sensor histidine kinase [Chelatococcus asaccharovorans]PXW64816.1 two-component system phosphate regulon sensor histidine kinase PhoR [Chelatococcus asaccharovorans]CAH1662653.1 Phosphate regulon sensor protein PhoR [Chelatococcus asaccharovorans]CAH1683107.1 Phosphate regulon sensor protein PhoR [Chelatococcus asaccharovorans]